MKEKEIIDLFLQIAEVEKCPDCGSKIEGGYYNPEELVKGPSDGVPAVRIPIKAIMEAESNSLDSLALYVECQKFGSGCRFREPFYRFYKTLKRKNKNDF